MTPLTQYVDQLTGPAIILHLADILRKTSEDFPESEVRYHKAVDELRTALPEGYIPTLDAYLEAKTTSGHTVFQQLLEIVCIRLSDPPLTVAVTLASGEQPQYPQTDAATHRFVWLM